MNFYPKHDFESSFRFEKASKIVCVVDSGVRVLRRISELVGVKFNYYRGRVQRTERAAH